VGDYGGAPPEPERTLTVGREAIADNLEEAGRDIEQGRVLCTDQSLQEIKVQQTVRAMRGTSPLN
jgi:hypothetical protein